MNLFRQVLLLTEMLIYFSSSLSALVVLSFSPYSICREMSEDALDLSLSSISWLWSRFHPSHDAASHKMLAKDKHQSFSHCAYPVWVDWWFVISYLCLCSLWMLYNWLPRAILHIWLFLGERKTGPQFGAIYNWSLGWFLWLNGTDTLLSA